MNNHSNHVLERLAAKQSAIGAKVDLPSPDIVEIIGRAGYDFTWIDCEHGAFDLEMVVHMMRAADATGTTPIVRVPSQDATGIMRVLDAGAMGVIIPNVTTAHQARTVTLAAKYQTPELPGHRGACPRIRAAGHQVDDWRQFAKWSNENTMVWLLVESLLGADNVIEIARVPGVDAIMLGPFDLSVSMGYPGDVEHPAVVSKLEEITEKVLAQGIDVVAVLLSQEDEALIQEKRHWEKRGCRIFNVISDRRQLATGFRKTIALSR